MNPLKTYLQTLIVLLAVTVVGACGDEDEPVVFTVTPQQLTIQDGSTPTVSIQSNVDWYVSMVIEPWLTVTPMTGSGNATVTLAASGENSTRTARKAQIVLTERKTNQALVVNVTQLPPTLKLIASSTTVELSHEGGQAIVAVTANAAWTASVSESWCTVSPLMGNGDAQLTLSANQNFGSKRSATVTLTLLDGSEKLTADIFISQEVAGREAVDLGLPSGTKWANMNVGATKPTDYGLYFAWGETKGYGSDTNDGRLFNWASYKWSNGSAHLLTKYCTETWYGTLDGKTTLDPEDDAAYVNWGSDWRMPTIDEVEELIANTTSEWVTVDGVNGFKCTSKKNGKSIFFPAAGKRSDSGKPSDSGLIQQAKSGEYWSSTIRLSSLYGGIFQSFTYSVVGYASRCHGLTVRPVRKN